MEEPLKGSSGESLPNVGPEALPVLALVAINSQHVHSSLAPWCLKAALAAHARAGHRCAVVEGTVNEPFQELLGRVLAQGPAVVGISCQIWNMAAARRLARALKEALPSCVLVFGGPEVSYDPEEVLRENPGVDYVVCGEGERPFAALADALLTGQSPRGLPGVRGREGEGACEPFCAPEPPPSPYCPEYFARLQGRIAYLETSRGCPFRCAFCLSGRREQQVRALPLGRVREELTALARSGARAVKLVDRTFNADPARARAILSFILKGLGREIPGEAVFHFEVAGDLLDGETLALLNGAPPGLFSLEIGVQSFHPETLAAARRRTDLEKLSRAVEGLVAAGRVRVHLDLIAGLPLEGLEALARSFDRAFALKPHALQLNRLKVIRGSAIREEPERFPLRYDPEPPYAVLETPWMDPEDFERLRDTELGLERGWNRRRFVETLSYLCGPAGLSAFSVFTDLGRRIRQAEEETGGALSLEEMTARALKGFLSLAPGREEAVLNRMLLDRLASTRSAVIPACLKRRFPGYRQARARLDAVFPRPDTPLRAAAVSFSEEAPRMLWSDFEKRDPVSGLYAVRSVRLDALL